MEVMTQILNSFDGSWLTLMGRALVGSTWTLALWQIWKARHAPLANQAFVAALAIVVSEIILIFHHHISVEAITFFWAMAQVVMAISVVKIFRWARHLTRAEVIRIAAVEDYETNTMDAFRTYTSSLLVVTLAGMAYFALVWIEQGHLF